MNRLKRVEKSLLAHCLGHYPELPIGDCCEYISWLAKFHKLPQARIRFLADWACCAMGTLTATEEEAFWEEYRIRSEKGELYK